MPRGDQVARLYTLVMDLARTRRGLTAARLADKRELRLRTVYRDLAALQEVGFPVTKVDGGRWKLIDGWGERIPFPVTAGELLALHIAGEMMAPLAATRAGKDFAKLHKRLTGRAPRRDRAQGELFAALRSPLRLPVASEIAGGGRDDIVEELWAAVDERHTVRARYAAVTSPERGWRRIDPYLLHYDPKLESLYAIGWCHRRAAVRTFAVHRFEVVEPTGDGFEPDPNFDVERYLKHSFGIWTAKESIQVELHIAPRAAAWIKERRWHSSQKVRERADGSIDLAMTVADSVEIERWILGLGDAVRVLEPAALREQIRAVHRRAAGEAETGPAWAPLPAKKTLTSDDKERAQDRAHARRRKPARRKAS